LLEAEDFLNRSHGEPKGRNDHMLCSAMVFIS